MAKSRLNKNPERLPAWLDSPKMRAAFMGGITESAMYQGGRATATRTRESAEAENKRRWELLRQERKRASERDIEAQETREQMEKDKFTWEQGAAGRQLASQQAIEQWRAEQELEKQKMEWQREADAMEELDAYRRDLIKKGTPDDRVKAAVAIKRKRLGLPEAKAMKPATAPTTKTIIGPDGLPHVMAFDPATGQYSVDVGVAGTAYQKPDAPEDMSIADVKQYMDMAGKTVENIIAGIGLADEQGHLIDPKSHLEQVEFMEKLWPTIESYYKMDPTLAEYTMELAKQKLSKQNGEYLDRLYQQELVQPAQQQPQQAPTPQPAPAPAPAQSQQGIRPSKSGKPGMIEVLGPDGQWYETSAATYNPKDWK